MSNSAKFWDKTAARYANSTISDEAAYQRKLAETRTYFSPEMRVLEFGCGTGSTAIHHAPYVQHIDALDISENMLQIGRDNAAAAHVSNISFSRCTLTAYGAPDASYDAVLGLNVIHLLSDRQTVLAEVSRILKPGGAFISSTACLGASWLRYIKLLAPLGKLLGLMPDVYVMTEEQLAKEVTDSGMQIERQWHHGTHNMAVFIIARKEPVGVT